MLNTVAKIQTQDQTVEDNERHVQVSLLYMLVCLYIYVYTTLQSHFYNWKWVYKFKKHQTHQKLEETRDEKVLGMMEGDNEAF